MFKNIYLDKSNNILHDNICIHILVKNLIKISHVDNVHSKNATYTLKQREYMILLYPSKK